MSNTTNNAMSKRARWGWGILLAVSILIVLNGAALYFISGSPATFEQDTGFAYEEVAAAFPGLAEQVISEGQLVSVLLAVVGLMAAVASWAGFRSGARWAWAITAILLVLLAFFTLRFLVFDGRADIGGTYLGLAVIAFVGQVLSARN